MQVINKIGRPRSGSPICFITSMITDWIGRHEVLLPINRNYNKIRERNKIKTFQEKNSFHPEMRSRENSKEQLPSCSAHAMAHTVQLHCPIRAKIVAGDSQSDAINLVIVDKSFFHSIFLQKHLLRHQPVNTQIALMVWWSIYLMPLFQRLLKSEKLKILNVLFISVNIRMAIHFAPHWPLGCLLWTWLWWNTKSFFMRFVELPKFKQLSDHGTAVQDSFNFIEWVINCTAVKITCFNNVS